MVNIDDRIQFIEKNLDKVQKQVEDCNPTPLDHVGWTPETNLLHNYGSATLELDRLRKDLYNKKPGILTSKREKENYDFQEKRYLDLRSRHEKLGKDFAKNCTCTNVPK